ncbi:MAG: hypothetical protein ABSD27_10825 [Bryobacteraceae bacterium]|jgi:hypothetical protein
MEIEREHPEYAAKKAMWRVYRHLYAGGDLLKANATEYLVRRQKEPLDVYSERLDRVFYENYIGSIIDWYAATLFRREPILSFTGENEAGKAFFCEFTEDCDRKQTSLADFFRRQLVETLVGGAGYILVDFPRVGLPAANRGEEDAMGASRAYLVEYRPEDLINWSYDEEGNYAWVVLRTSGLRTEASGGGWVKETRWAYYDKERFQLYRAEASGGGDRAQPALVDEGRHGLAAGRRVPLFQLKVSEGLWLMNKAALLQLEHFNKSNALGWALTMGLFAMPVVYSDREWKQIVGESYYIQLAPGDKFGWTEPEGHVYEIAVENLNRLKDEIYRVCYLLPQAWDPSTPQSGLSKLRDFTITHEVLRAYGDAAKDTMKRVLRAIEAARQDGLTIDVSGLDEFDIGDFASELDDAKRLLELGIGSPTLKREIFKKLACKYLCDVRQELKDQIAREIEANAEGLANG